MASTTMNAILATEDLIFDNTPSIRVYHNWEVDTPTILVKEEEEVRIEDDKFSYETDSKTNSELDEWEEFVLKQNILSLNQSIEYEIDYLKEENISTPSEQVIKKTEKLLRELAFFKIHPYKLGISSEEGICLTFDNFNNKMYFELYNDQEIGFIIEDKLTGKVIQNTDVNSVETGLKAIEKFYWNYAFSERITY